MDTSLWMEHGTKTRSNLIVTPENFVLTQETILTGVGEKADPDEVTFLRPGKAFFTYDEAIAMFEQDQFPKGWRLPTYEEAAALLEEFTDEDDSCRSCSLTSTGMFTPRCGITTRTRLLPARLSRESIWKDVSGYTTLTEIPCMRSM